ncbi:MAG: hypothetical protein ACRDJN_13940 [Chloroflexota bacterium]
MAVLGRLALQALQATSALCTAVQRRGGLDGQCFEAAGLPVRRWDSPAFGRPPRATVLTNDYHERDAYALRERWQTPVWAPAAGLRSRGGELDGEPDYT